MVFHFSLSSVYERERECKYLVFKLEGNISEICKGSKELRNTLGSAAIGVSSFISTEFKWITMENNRKILKILC